MVDGLWIQVLEGAGLDPAGLDERVDIGLLQPDDPAESVGRQLPLIDESVQAFET